MAMSDPIARMAGMLRSFCTFGQLSFKIVSPCYFPSLILRGIYVHIASPVMTV